ncbi:MAG: endonuclease/exonuclease/phosphatase family [Rhodospirillaceae bacterium]|nr:MAG: endonuclease/exonuclease/phosphatase family [Rhodospirillaceae bacterium]TNC94631.1 MAG: endonuclease/exonuclease/phosphatase family protein [Stygiobacter sp.]
MVNGDVMFHGTLGKDEEFLSRLKVLRDRIAAAEIPDSVLDQSLNIATWNIREFGRKKRYQTSVHLLAEIANQFDLIALVELRDDLGDLRRMMEVLGDYWKVVYCDYRTDSAGNRERIGYLYDSRVVRFTGLAAEADPPRTKKNGEWTANFADWWRSPYMASFKAGSFEFVVCTLHARWGSERTTQEREQRRREELANFARWIKERVADKGQSEKDWLIMGDFNITQPEMLDDLKLSDFHIPPGLLQPRYTSVSRKHAYDQILHAPTMSGNITEHGGIIDFVGTDWKVLCPSAQNMAQFTRQLSDHFPLWIQIRTDVIANRIENAGLGD